MNNDSAIPDFTQINELTNNSSPGPSSDAGQSDSWNDKRVVVHVDLNSFYPSCEELRFPLPSG